MKIFVTQTLQVRNEERMVIVRYIEEFGAFMLKHGLRTPNEGINQRYLKNWADMADKICFGRT